jgi:hypothetical protein
MRSAGGIPTDTAASVSSYINPKKPKKCRKAFRKVVLHYAAIENTLPAARRAPDVSRILSRDG